MPRSGKAWSSRPSRSKSAYAAALFGEGGVHPGRRRNALTHQFFSVQHSESVPCRCGDLFGVGKIRVARLKNGKRSGTGLEPSAKLTQSFRLAPEVKRRNVKLGSGQMIKVSVMYPNTPGARFDHEYYRDKHMPLVKARMGDACKSYTVDKGLAGGAPGAPATYVGMCHIFCDSVEAFQAGFGPHAEEIMADIPNYTDQIPVIQISDVVVG
jgi:uncharacterized protein (TIGR02118 family)